MRKKRSAKLRALVVAFALVFAGFAALMTVPHFAVGATINDQGVEQTPVLQGEEVSIYADVENATNVQVNMTHPDGTEGEHAMEMGGNGMYYFNMTYHTIGTYSNHIYAWNETLKTESAAFTFDVKSDGVPYVESMSASPDPAAYEEPVDITATIENATYDGVSVFIQHQADPTVNTTETMSAPFNSMDYSYSFVDPTWPVGVINYTITAMNETGAPTTSMTQNFTIEDRPYIESVPIKPVKEWQGTTLNVTATIRNAVNAKVVVGTDEYVMNAWGMDNYSAEFSYDAVGTYNYHVWANDTEGDNSTSDTYTFELYNVETGAATDLTPTGATVDATFTMHGYDNVTLWFAYNTTGNTLEHTTSKIFVNESSNVSNTDGLDTFDFANKTGTISAALSGLSPYTTYDYRVIVENAGETTPYYGEIKDFTTTAMADFTVPTEDIWVGENATFNASSSVGMITDYQWTIDDTNEGTDMEYTHVFSTAGEHVVNLTVTDDNGETNTMSTTVTVWDNVVITVLDDADDSPIEGADVYIAEFGVEEMATTDADGTVMFPVNTDYSGDTLDANIGHYMYQTAVVEVTGMTDTVKLTAKSEWIVEVGPVVNEDENNIGGAEVTLEWGESGTATETTDLEGMANVMVDEDPREIEFTYTITHEDFQDATGTFTGEESGTITLSDIVYHDLVLGPVQDDDGNVIENAGVEFTYDGDDYSNITDTSGEAHFSVPFDPSGITFNVTVDAEGFVEETFEEVGANEAITLQLATRDFTVRVGPIKDNAGEFVEGATVTLTWDGEEEVGTTNANGIAVFTVNVADIDNIDFTATISHDDLDEDETVTFTGESGGSTTIDVGEEDGAGSNMMLYAGIGIVIIIIIIVIVMMMMKKPAEGPAEEEFGEEEEFVEEDIGEEEELFEEEEEEDLFGEEDEFAEEEGEEDLFEEEDEFAEEEEGEELFEEEEEEDLFDEDEDL